MDMAARREEIVWTWWRHSPATGRRTGVRSLPSAKVALKRGNFYYVSEAFAAAKASGVLIW